jgi:hypothetical protein
VFGSVRKPADADRLRSEFGTNFVPLRPTSPTKRPDPMRHLITAIPPKRMVDKIIAKQPEGMAPSPPFLLRPNDSSITFL